MEYGEWMAADTESSILNATYTVKVVIDCEKMAVGREIDGHFIGGRAWVVQERVRRQELG